MKIKLLIIFFGAIADFKTISAQKIIVPLSFQSLMTDNKPVAGFSWENMNGNYVRITDYPFNTFPQNLIKNRDGLFVFVNGSGRLYKAAMSDSAIIFTRLDSTIFSGYNLGSYAFSYNDSIYSFGGYGFWKINGQLRVFINETKQWDIVKLNKEIPILHNGSDMLWYDLKDKKIFIGYTTERNEALKPKGLNDADYLYDVSVLDLVTKQWQKLGKLSDYFKEKKLLLKDLTSSPWGQFAELGNKFLIIDYANNHVLSLKPFVDDKLRPLVAARSYTDLFYFKDSTLFFGSTFKNHLDSVQLHASDFVVTDEKVYSAYFLLPDKYWIIIFIAFFLFTLASILIIKRNKRKKVITNFNVQNGFKEKISNTITKAQIVFEKKELEILKLISANSLKGETTSIDEFNKILGVTKRSSEIQKKQRSDTLISINKKFNFVSGKEENIIQKKRSDPDKRSFEYFIEYAKLKDVTGFLNGQV